MTGPGSVGRRAGVAGTRDGERGTTLVETMVSMMIFGIVMAVTVSVFLTIQAQTRDSLGRTESVQNARMGLLQIDRMVRSGNLFYDPFENGGNGMRMLVFTQANGQRQCAEWRVTSTGELQTRSWAPNWQVDPSAAVSGWGTTARHLVNQPPASPAFRRMPVGDGGQMVIQVRLLVHEPGDHGAPVDVTASVSGRNTLFGYDPAVCRTVPPD